MAIEGPVLASLITHSTTMAHPVKNADRRRLNAHSPKNLPAHYQLYKTARCLAEQGFSDIVTAKHPPTQLAGISNTPPGEDGGNDGSIHQGSVNSKEDNNSRFFKTRLCLFHQKGACVRGNQCSYAHDDEELKPPPNLVKTRLCQDWLNGRCSAEVCKFAHGRHELRFTHDYFKTKLCHFWQQGGCTKGDLCRHAHGEGELRPMPEGAEQPGLGGGSNYNDQQQSPSTSSTSSTATSTPANIKMLSGPPVRKGGDPGSLLSSACPPKKLKSAPPTAPAAGEGLRIPTTNTVPMAEPLSATTLSSRETTYSAGGLHSGCSTVNREEELDFLRFPPSSVVAEEDQPMIPSPGTSSGTTLISPVDREAAVLEALRLAEEARRLVARSTELLAGSVDGPPAPASAPPTHFQQVPGNIPVPAWSLQSQSRSSNVDSDKLASCMEGVNENDLFLDDILGQNDIGDLADLLAKLLLNPGNGSSQY